MKKRVFFTTCLMLLSSFIFGQHWTFDNDVEYSGNMTIIAEVQLNGDNQLRTDIEIAAFHKDVLRGVATPQYNKNLDKYLVYLPIAGITERELITFKMFDPTVGTEGQVFDTDFTVEYKDDFKLGTTSNPQVIDFYKKHWNDVFYEDYMTLVCTILIDGQEPDDYTNIEIAAFCGNEIRGVARPEFWAGPNIYITSLLIGGETDGEKIDFKLYDPELGEIPTEYSVNFKKNETLGDEAPLSIEFITTPYVAQVGDKKYQSLDKAFAAAQAGDVIKMLEDITLDQTIKVTEDKTVTLDLNGKTIDGTEKVRIAIMSYGKLTIKDSTTEQNGTIKAGIGTAGNAINICGGTFTLESGNIYSKNNAILIDEQAATININGGKITAEPTTRNSAAFYISSTSETVVNIVDGDIKGYNGILLWNNTEVNVSGGTINATGSTAIQGNGSKDNTEINITAGTLNGYYAAIYHPQGGELNIYGGELTGWTGVVVKGGKVNINGGTINGIGTADTYRPVSSGYVDTGDALYVEHYDSSTNSENYGTPVVTVTGGTFNSTNAKPIASYVNNNNNIEALARFVSGGTFNKEIEAGLCAEGYVCEFNTTISKYEVKVGLNGSGTVDDPFIIMDLDDLTFFRNSVNAGETIYSAPGVYVALGADIDMTGVNWVGIGSATADHGFMGNFDGKTYKIQNLTITNPALDSDGYAYAGLFSVTEGTDKDNQNTIKNLTIENVTITTTGHIVSAAIAYPYYTIVDNVKVCGDIKIKGGDYTSGVLAYTRRCVNASNLSIVGNDGSYVKGTQTVGGVISDIQMNGGLTAVYSNFSAEGITVTGEKSVGGIAGIIATQTLNGATVKNVALSSQDAFAGVVAGRLGGTSTISNVVAENVTGATAVVGATYDGAKAVEARIGDTYYGTFAAALEAAQAGEEITLLTDIEASEVILIGKSVVINGNGHKVTSSASRVFRITTSDVEVALKDVNMVSTAKRVGTNDVRGISIDIVDNVKLTLNNSSVDFTDASANDWAYAVNVTGGNNHAVTINGGTYEGANVINVRGANNTIVVENTTLNCTYPNNDMYAGACIWVLQNQGSSVEATGNTFNGNNAIAFNLGTGTALTESNNTDNTKVAVAKIGDVYYTSVNDAINAAENGATVQLLKRTIDEAIAPWAGDSQHRLEKSITIVGYTDFGTTLTGGLFLGYNDGTVRDNTITVKGINFVGKGVTVANQKNVVIEGNKFTGIDALVSEKHGNSGSAILVIGSENNKSIVATVKNNVIENVTLASQAGIYMSQVANATVEGNTVTGTTHNAITISAATDATINVTNNTLEHWGKGGEGRAMRISGGTTVNVNGNVMSNTAAPEEFVKITGATTIDASKNYWNGVSPLSMFNTDLAKDPVEILVDYYTDVEKKNRVVLEKSVAKIGTKYYQSFASAIAAVKNGETIKLLTDCDEEVTIKQVVNKNFIINGNGKTYTGTINVNGNNKGAGLTGAGLTITNVNFVLNGQWQSGIFANKGTYACNIIVDKCSFTGNNAKEAYGIRLRSGYNITVKNITGKNLYDLVYAQENVKGFTAENVNVTDSNIGFWFPYGNNLNFINVNLDVTGTGVGIINRNAGEATFEKCTIIAKNAVTLSQDNNNAIAYTLKFNGENEFTTSEEWLTVTGTNAVLKAVLNDAELDVTETSGLVANIGNVYYNTLQHAINAAQDGNTVAIANDFTLDSKKYETQNDDYATLVNVKDKAVTIDLNGKTMTVNPTAADFTNAKGAMLLGIFSADTDGHLTLVDSSDDAKGTVNVNVNDAKVYSFGVSESLYADKSNSGELTIKSGNYNVIGTLANAMFFSDADEVITINGGKFHLDNASTIANYPWFVNTLGNNELQVIVNGGTFNVDINHQYRPFEIKIAETLAVKNNGDGTWTIVPAEAFVTEMLGSTVNEAGGNEHKVGYATLKEAVEAVNNLGNDVTLLKNVEMEEILVLDKAVNLNGAGYTLSSKAERAINVATEGEVNISNLTIATTNNTERAINVIQKAANLTLTDVKAEGFKYTINVASSSVGSTITTNGGKFSGYAAVNITGSKTSFTSTNTEFIGINNASLHESNNYGVIVVNAAPTENVNVNINGGKVVAQTTVNRQFIVDAENAKDANITINAELVLANGDVLNATIENGLVVKVKAEYADELLAQGYVSSAADANGLVTVLGVKVAQVEDTYYATLQDAIDAADGKTVVVLTDIDLTEGVTVAAGKVVTLDLNDNTVTGTPTEAKAYAVITNNGNLTIKNGSIICDHKLAGSTGYAVNAITNGGTLTIDGATVENKSTAQYQIGYAIDNNSTTGNAVVVVKSGAVRASGSYYYDGIRQFCNSLTNENDVTIEGGEVSSLWMQNPSDGAEKNTKDVKGSFSITGGEVDYVYTEPSTEFTASITGGTFVEVAYNQEDGVRDLKNYITGGTFGMDVTEPFCAFGYEAEYNIAGNNYIVRLVYGTQTRELASAGWYWFSSYIDIEGEEGLEDLQEALNGNGKEVRGQDGFTRYYPAYQSWTPGLKTVSTEEMYMINTTAPVTISLEGDFVAEDRPITLNPGWNWIGYPVRVTVPVEDALAGFTPQEGDIIKSKSKVSEYSEEAGGWFPSFDLVPGEGYKYDSKLSITTNFVYSTTITNASASKGNVAAEYHWTPAAGEYAENMVVIAMLDINGEYANENYEVAAFANGECRGSARPIYNEKLDKHMLFMTVCGDEVEEMTFKCYDVNSGREYDLINRVVYSNDAVVGSMNEPYIFTCSTLGIGEATLSDINIYPNPTTTDREINLQATCDKVEVFNTLGVKVAEYQNVDSIDALETAGTYVIRVTLNGDVKHCRLVVK